MKAILRFLFGKPKPKAKPHSPMFCMYLTEFNNMKSGRKG